MRHLNQIFEKLGLNRENGLYITNEDKWEGLLSNRTSRLIKERIQPEAFFCIDNKPFILFFENLTNIKEKLQQIWNFNESPIIIISNADTLQIYNGFKHFSKTDTLKTLVKEDSLSDFSYFELVTGKTWEKYQNAFKYENRVDYYLLTNIKNTRNLLIEKNLSKELTNSLLGKVIFVRYLIDRGVKLDFEQQGNSRVWTNNDFCELLNDKEKVKLFFSYLKSKFNGDLFPMQDEEIESIPDECLSIIIKLLSGEEVGTGQFSLFDLYDFSIIPVEFISNVYELFIGQNQQEKQGAYYTPLFLVDYILAETVEKKFRSNTEIFDCKVLDPSCGSGIFLVETLRKIIEQYQKNNPSYLENPEEYKNQLKQLAIDNIFGVDKDKSAVNVAIFSIYLTLLDYQKPSDIESFRFPLLYEKNFFSDDFFNIESAFNEQFKKLKFDFILGNPPWKRGKGEKLPLFEKYIKERKKIEKGKYTYDIEIGNSEIAQAFVLRISDFCKENTQVGFIVTSKMFYNLNGKGFREYLLDRFAIDRVFELAPVRKEVFDKSNDKAIAPATILFYRLSEKNTDDNVLEHITLKPSRFFKLFKVFTIQRNDYKKVTQNQLKDYDFLWKVLVYGNFLDFNLINSLFGNYGSINQVIEDKKILVKQGVKRKDGTKKISVPNLKEYEFIDTQKKQLSQFFISPNLNKWNTDEVGYIYKVNEKPFVELFEPYSLLITGGITKDFRSKAAINHNKRVFTSSIRAIKIFNKEEDLDFLYNVNGLICSSLFSYYMLMTGSSAGIEREESEDHEVLNFFYSKSQKIIKKVKEIEKEKYLAFEKIEPLNNSNTELDKIVINEFIKLKSEEVLIDYAMNITIPMTIGNGVSHEIIFQPLKHNSQELINYVNTFFERFNPIYQKANQKIVVEIKHTNQLIGLFFKIVSTNEEIEEISFTKTENNKILQALATLGNEKITDRLFIQKDIRGFEENGFYIVKPNEKRLWHKALAYYDVNEFMDAILIAGKQNKTYVQ